MAKKMTITQDNAFDRVHGIKIGSKRDDAMDKKHGVPTVAQRKKGKK
jgi:hypothetical protein